MLLIAIKQGYDRPVSVTAAISRPLAPFTGIYNVEKKKIDTITKCVMVLLVVMGLVLVLLETVMTLWVSAGNWSTSIGVLLKPINPNGICPKTHYRKPYFNDYKLMI